MLERVPGVLPLDNTATVSVQADRASVEWRRRLAALTVRLTAHPRVTVTAVAPAAASSTSECPTEPSDGLR